MKTPNMKFHPQNLVILLATLAIAPVVYPSQTNSYSALSSASSSSVGVNQSDKANAVSAPSTSSNQNAQPNATQIALIQRFYKLGDTYFSKNPQQAIRYYEQAEILGSSDARNALGYIFLTGAGNIKRDYKRAFDYLTKAAAQGNSDALANLGSMHQNGVGVTKDPKQAISYYEQAAAQNNPVALYNLGYMHRIGQGTPKDIKRALDCIEKSAQLGFAAALNTLGYILQSGEGDVTQDYKRALDYFRKAANKNYTAAFYNLGNMHQIGKGTPQDIKRALGYFEQAAQKGFLIAQRELGRVYFYGSGTRKNRRKALTWILAAAKNNCHDAQVFVYPFLQEGIDISRDTKKAAEFFEKITKEVGSAQAARKLIVMNYYQHKPSELRFPLPCAGEKCTICTSSFAWNDEITVLPCNHYFCEPCITPLITKHGACPTCHQKTTLEQCEIRITSAKA